MNPLLRLPGLYHLAAFLTARRAVVHGPSMRPTLAAGEYVLFDRLAYRMREPGRGDVVLASHPSRPRTRIVKRVAGVPGDEVAVEGDRCWVNGVPCWEAMEDASPPDSARRWTLADGEWLLLGDAPEVSTDGRDFGPVSREMIHARAWLVYWPPRRMRTLRR